MSTDVRGSGKIARIVLLSALLLSACGGGGSSSTSSSSVVTTPSGTFTLSFSPSQISLLPGLSQTLQIQVNGQNGFSGAVTISALNLPSGITVSPASILVNSGGQGSLSIAAVSNASTGSGQITIQALDTPLQIQAQIPATVQPLATPMSRPFTTLGGQINRGFYDESRQLLFVTNLDLNEVDVLSGANLTLQSRISVPQPVGIDQMPDGDTLLVGSMTQGVYTISENSYAVSAHYAPNFSQVEGTTTLFPAAVALANGKVLILGQDLGVYIDYVYGGQHLIEWDTSTNTFTQVLLPGAGPSYEIFNVRRSADHKWALLAAQNLYLYGSDADSFTSGGAIVQAFDFAANSSGTQFVVAGNSTLTFYDRSLQVIGTVTSTLGGLYLTGVQYSTDDSKLYWNLLAATGGGGGVLDVVDANKFAEIGHVTVAYESSEPTMLGWTVPNGRLWLLSLSTLAV